jgi:hypothetical protein
LTHIRKPTATSTGFTPIPSTQARRATMSTGKSNCKHEPGVVTPAVNRSRCEGG